MQFDHLQRREFVALFGGTAVAWPLAARAQRAEPVRRIGIQSTLAADDAVAQTRNAAFFQALQQLGWTKCRRRCSPAPTRPSNNGRAGRAQAGSERSDGASGPDGDG
jgi:hypothetical protein